MASPSLHCARDTTSTSGRAYCARESPSAGSTAGRGIGTGRRSWQGLSATSKRAALLGSPLFAAMRADGTRRDPEVRLGAPRPPRPDDLPARRQWLLADGSAARPRPHQLGLGRRQGSDAERHQPWRDFRRDRAARRRTTQRRCHRDRGHPAAGGRTAALPALPARRTRICSCACSPCCATDCGAPA